MSELAPDMTHRVSSDELRMMLESQIHGLGTPCRVVKLNRRPLIKSSSFELEELDIDLENGTRVDLVFKNLSYSAMLKNARRIKPSFLYDPLREIEAYQRLLANACLGTAFCYGAVLDPDDGRFLLFLERVTGEELYEVGEFDCWLDAARWLARLHSYFAERTASCAFQPGHLLRYDHNFFTVWQRRAVRTLEHSEQVSPTTTRMLVWLEMHYDGIIRQLVALTPTLIHGEYYASNVLIRRNMAPVEADGGLQSSLLRVCPVDWEMAAIGPGLLDVAALIAGKWTESEKESLARAYYLSLETEHRMATEDAFFTALDSCRLHLALAGARIGNHLSRNRMTG